MGTPASRKTSTLVVVLSLIASVLVALAVLLGLAWLTWNVHPLFGIPTVIFAVIVLVNIFTLPAKMRRGYQQMRTYGRVLD